MPYIQLLFRRCFIAEYCACSDVATVEGFPLANVD